MQIQNEKSYILHTTYIEKNASSSVVIENIGEKEGILHTNENAKINIGFLMISRRLEEHSRRLHPVLLLELPTAKLPSADSKQGQSRR